MSDWGQAVNNSAGFGFSSEAFERNTTLGDVRVTEDGEFRVTDNSPSEGYASIYFSTWSGQTDLINNG